MDYQLRDLLSNMMSELECLIALEKDLPRQKELSNDIKMYFYDFVDSIED